MKNLSLFLIFVLFSCQNSIKPLLLAPVFSDHMVLQQKSDVSIWGSTSPNQDVFVEASWDEKVITKSDKDGEWNIKIKTPSYGGPYNISFISLKDSILLKDILIGEVWLASGQSNMQWKLSNRLVNQQQEIANANYNQIRMFTVPLDLTGVKIKNSKWKISNSENVKSFSAVGYFFARRLHVDLNIPIGIINTSWGGTRVEAWTSLKKLSTLNATKDIISNLDLNADNNQNNKKVNDANAYSILFKKMLFTVLPYGIRGAIWYQGEANVGNYEEYNELFPAMIEDWRERWGYDFPFYYVQIAPFNYGEGKLSHELRDVQRKSLKTKNTGMTVTMDIGEANDIHPANKQDVGNRLALLALDNDYGYDLVSSGPLYKNHELHNDYIDIDFDSKGSGLLGIRNLEGFEIAGSDGVFENAQAIIVDNKVRVSSGKVDNPTQARYAWKNVFDGTLFNKEGLPASSFITNK